MGASPDTAIDITAFRNVDTASVLDGSYSEAATPNSNFDGPSVTTTNSRSLVIVGGVLSGKENAPLVAPTGYHLVSQMTGVALASKLKTVAGLEDPGAFSGGSSADASTSFTFALKSN